MSLASEPWKVANYAQQNQSGTGTGVGFNGYSYNEPLTFGEDKTGIPKLAIGGFSKMAGYLLKGSQDASQTALKGFEAGFRSRAEGLAAGFGEQQNRLGGEVASQGYSPDLVRRMLAGGQASTQAQIGQARGEADQGFAMHLADLQKNTGLELSNISRDQMNLIMQSYLAKKAGGKKSAFAPILGAAGGIVGGIYGGPGGAAVGYQAGTALGGSIG